LISSIVDIIISDFGKDYPAGVVEIWLSLAIDPVFSAPGGG
jgi:hypothetical protein